MKIKEKIISLFETKKELSVSEITNTLFVSKQMVHLVLNKLLEIGFVEKFGRTPKTIYKLKEVSSKKIESNILVSNEKQNFLIQNCLMISEIDQILTD